MNELYAEYGVKRKETAGTVILRICMVLFAITFFLFSFQSSFLLVFGTLMIIGLFYIFPLMKVEYEYVFCDGQLDFDKVMGNKKRKRCMRIQFENVELIAPDGSSALDGYGHTDLKRRDFSSMDKSKKKHIIILRNGEVLTAVFFEPSEKMLQCMKNKAPRKVVME